VIFADTNVVSETLRKVPDKHLLDWLIRFDAEIALPTVTIAEIAFGIHKIRPDQRAERPARGLEDWRTRFAGRIYPFTEPAALAYGTIMGEANRRGRPLSVPDGMIAAIAIVNRSVLATRNIADFRAIPELDLVNPWDFR
jgi:predicted nucleic acid-binding protein